MLPMGILIRKYANLVRIKVNVLFFIPNEVLGKNRFTRFSSSFDKLFEF